MPNNIFFSIEIFLKCSWNCKKEIIDQLFDYLTNAGLSIWKDDEGGISGNILDDMASGWVSGEENFPLRIRRLKIEALMKNQKKF